MSQFVRLTRALNDKGKLINEDTVYDNIDSAEKEWYQSVYYYSDALQAEFKKTGSVAGMTDVVTNKLVYDFDSKDDLTVAQRDAQTLVGRLLEKGVDKAAIQTYFSGSKGFTVQVLTNSNMTPKQLKLICFEANKDLTSLDPTLYNANRILRVPGTKHPSSGLYKVPLTLQQLNTFTVDQIKARANSLDNVTEDFNWTVADLPTSMFDVVKPQITVNKIESTEVMWASKPKWLSNCRFAMQNGLFKEGSRSTAFLCLAATYKNQGFEIEHTYRLLKGVAKKQAEYTGGDRFSDNDLYNNVCIQVYSSQWKNGQFSCREPGSFLHDYCESLGEHKCNRAEKNLTVSTDRVFDLFTDYAKNYEKNVLFTGIQSLDKQVKFMVGTSNGIVAAPGVGKTSLSLQILEHNSANDIQSVFFSYDMFHSAVAMRVLQRHSGLSQEKIYDIFKSNHADKPKLQAKIADIYKNVHFCFKSGQTLDEIEETILDTQDRTGKKVKLAIVDYNELVSTSISDPTAASAAVAQRLRQIANEREVCIITLLQPSKMYSAPSEPVTSANSAKGSGAINQSVTVMLGCSRPGFSPITPENDKYFNITCLKNRNGPLFSVDLGWNGLRGQLTELEDSQRSDLASLRERIKLDKETSDEW